MGKRKLYREYDGEGKLVKLECGKCGVVKDVSEFSKNRSKKDGVHSTCNKCKSQYMALYRQDRKKEIAQYKAQYRQDHKEETIHYMAQYKAQYRQDHKKEIAQYHAQYYQDKVDIEIKRIYKNVTQKLYPNSGIQHGIIYGVHCSESGRWYIGQTQTSFQHRYKGDFFRNKVCELSENSINRHLLAKDVEKYGVDNFEVFEVLDVAFSERELDEKEAYYIDYYNAYEGGYNSNRGNIFKHNKAKRSEQN